MKKTGLAKLEAEDNLPFYKSMTQEEFEDYMTGLRMFYNKISSTERPVAERTMPEDLKEDG